eukprot:m.51789 g.51789  ORF g.51789 m.51789 type:complete len:526 (-) comp7333_c0_seq2:70-1647(-)
MAFELASCGHTVKVWGRGDGGALDLVSEFAPHTSTVNAIRWNHTGKVVASGGDDGRVVLSLPTGEQRGQQLCAFPDSIDISQQVHDKLRCVGFGGNSRYLVTGGTGRLVKIWDLKKQALAQTFKGHDGTVRCATFNADSTMIVSGAASGEVMLFGVQGASPPGRLGVTERPQPVNALELSPFEDNLLATVYDHGALRLWDTEAMALRTQFESAHQAAATAVGFSPFNHLLLCTAGLDGFLVFYDIEANRIVKEIECPEPLTSMAFMHDGATVAAGTSSGKILVYDLRGSPTPTAEAHAFVGPVYDLAFRAVESTRSTRESVSTSASASSSRAKPKSSMSPRVQAIHNAAAAASVTPNAQETRETPPATSTPISGQRSGPRLSSRRDDRPPQPSFTEPATEQPYHAANAHPNSSAPTASQQQVRPTLDQTSRAEAGPSSGSRDSVRSAGMASDDVAAVKLMIKEGLGSLQHALHKEIQNMHIEMIRQFQIQKSEMADVVQRLAVNEDLVTEIKRLRDENNRLRQRY